MSRASGVSEGPFLSFHNIQLARTHFSCTIGMQASAARQHLELFGAAATKCDTSSENSDAITMCMELAPYAQMTIFNMTWRILQANIGSMPRIISDMWIVGAAVDPKEVQEWEMLTSDLIVSLEKWMERYDAFESCDEHGAWKQLKEEAKEIAERHLPPHGRLMLEEYEYESEYYVQPADYLYSIFLFVYIYNI